MKARIMVLGMILLVCTALGAEERYRSFLFGAAYYPEHWPESYWEQDAKWMSECGVNVVRMGEFAWYYLEPEEGTYRFELFDRAIELLARHGIKTILGTPTAAPPKWLTQKYPEVLNAYPTGRLMNDQSRRHYTYNSPEYRRLSRKIVQALASHYRDNPNVIGWQTDNEFNCEVSQFYSESDRTAFREWLKQKYAALDSLNERWGTRFWSQWYTNWGQIDLPYPSPASHNPALMLDYKRFISNSAVQFQKEQVEIIRSLCPDDFITHNGYFKNLDYYELCKDLDIFAFDNYPCFRPAPQYAVGARLTLSRGFMGRFMIMEQQTGPGGQTYLLRTPRPGEMSLWAFQALAHGAEGLLHFRWRTARKGTEEYWFGVLDHDNVPGERFREFKKEGQQINRIGKEILGSKIISDLAVLKDFENEWVLDHQYLTEEVNLWQEYTDFFQAAAEMKYNLDFIGLGADFSRYKVIFAPHLMLMDQELAGKIRSFVERGGVFVLSAHSAVKDRDNGMTDLVQPILLDELFGMEREGFQCYPAPSREKNALRFQDGALVRINVFAEGLKNKTARITAKWETDYLKGGAACTENSAGKGRAVYYGSFFNLEAARYLIKRYAETCGIQPIITGLPEELEVTRRTKERTNYYFILNHADREAAISPGPGYYDLLEGKPFPESYTLKAFEYKVLRK